MSNVVDLPVVTSLPSDPKRILAAASNIEFERIIIIGRTEDGEEYFSSSDPDGGTILWDMERVRYGLMKITDDSE